MKLEHMSRAAGVLLLGVFLINVYIGVDDTSLQSLQPAHLAANWAIAVITLIAAIILFVRPRNLVAVAVAGIIWPVLYVGSLAFDVYTRLCFGGIAANCFPSKTTAFDYLILGSQVQGWVLWPGTIITAMVLMFVTFLLSIYVFFQIRQTRRIRSAGVPPPSASSSSHMSGPTP